MRIAVLGGGAWGTALGCLAAGKGFDAVLLVRDEELAGEINERHENRRYLPGLALDPRLRAGVSAGSVLSGAEVCVLAVPCQFMRAALEKVVAFLPDGAVLVCVSKGIETSSLKRMSEVAAEVLPRLAGRYAVLSGPSFAAEVMRGKPTAVVLGCADAGMRESLRGLFATGVFRVYSSPDVTGLELGGAVKNVMAIAAGLCDGLEFGHNARAALIARGLAEMIRLGRAMGARMETFMGLSGLGDLVLTCTGDLSRNRQVGLRLAAGENLSAITAGMRTVAEGVATTAAVLRLAEGRGVEMPVARAVGRILDGALPLEAARELMARALRDEY
ncbi:MAG: NAD(P)-dependent glycerol-3-phosphate dehydrogenase [Desulfovibrio sp.]|jgi:glycerol-3-phosphate dehydrogenase (NAD(P)+)|nr:NAD(P)-dependent glycerol-3-phosphate dehydrogenase [Desulfovibrio sp.]